MNWGRRRRRGGAGRTGGYTYYDIMQAVKRSAQVMHPLKQVELGVLKPFHGHEHWRSLLAQIVRDTMAPTGGIKFDQNLSGF